MSFLSVVQGRMPDPWFGMKMEDRMLNQLVILRAAMTRAGEITLDADVGIDAYPATPLRTVTNVMIMVIGICLALLGVVFLTTAI